MSAAPNAVDSHRKRARERERQRGRERGRACWRARLAERPAAGGLRANTTPTTRLHGICLPLSASSALAVAGWPLEAVLTAGRAQVGRAALALCSDLNGAVTGTCQYVDNGMHAMGLSLDSKNFAEYLDTQSGDPWDGWKPDVSSLAPHRSVAVALMCAVR